MEEVRPPADPEEIAGALRLLGADSESRRRLFSLLAELQSAAGDPEEFRERVRWPLVRAALGGGSHRLTLESGLAFDLRLDSRIERAALLADVERPDHVWEPQTSRLLIRLGVLAHDVIVGGAYIGDQALPVARAKERAGSDGVVHAFEVLPATFERLVHHVALNDLGNVRPDPRALWRESGRTLSVSGEPALSTASESKDPRAGEPVVSVSIDDLVREGTVRRPGLIMLDLEGGEEDALRGAETTLSGPASAAPALVFEIHRAHVDWSDGLERTPLVRFLAGRGYACFAIRDYHDNRSMAHLPIEIVPIDAVHLEGPPHGFNVLAVRDPDLVERHDLRVVRNVSPKLLVGRDPALHEPLSTAGAR